MISIIILTLNGGQRFAELLQAISGQDITDYELLVFDSFSDDDTVETAKSYGARIINIPRHEFDHGGTRTLAARQAKGDILVFFTQDAVPVDNHSISKLIAPLYQDPAIVVTYGRQLPQEDAAVFSAHLRWFNYPDLAELRSFADKKQYGLKTAFVSNSFAAYRKAQLAEVAYFKDGLIFGEDTCSVGRLLLKGYKIYYAAAAGVYHSHNYSCMQEFRRSFDIGVLHTREKWLLDTFGGAAGHGFNYIKSELLFILRKRKYILLPVACVRNFFKLIGYKLGRRFYLLPGSLRLLCSLQRNWWKNQPSSSRQ